MNDNEYRENQIKLLAEALEGHCDHPRIVAAVLYGKGVRMEEPKTEAIGFWANTPIFPPFAH